MPPAPADAAPTTPAFDLVTFGEPMILLLADGDLPLPVADRFDLSIAGAESNLATALARLGHRIGYFGRVGADAFGDRIRRGLRGEGIDVDKLLTDPELPTGLMIRDNAVARPIQVDYRRAGSAATRLSPDDLPADLLTRTRVLHVTGITAALSQSCLEATEQAMITAARAGALVSFDPNLRLRLAGVDQWRDIVDRLARHAHVVFTGRDEAETLVPGVQPHSWFADQGAGIVVVKDGASGATEYHGDTPGVHEPVRQVPLVDPVGAGDAFNAGWLSAWLQGATAGSATDARVRLRTGSAVASLVVTTRGDAAGLPDRTMLDRIGTDSADIIR